MCERGRRTALGVITALSVAFGLHACERSTPPPSPYAAPSTGSEHEASAQPDSVPPLRPPSTLRSPADDRRDEVGPQKGLAPPQ